MKPEVGNVIDRLRRSRSLPWLRVIDDARLDGAVPEDPTSLAVASPYQWLLRRIGDGVRLTQAGYLPPALVTEAMTELGWQDRWIGKYNREDMTMPILELRESAQRFGLLRKYRGRLLPTKVGQYLIDDSSALWWHLADRLPDGRAQPARQAGVLHLLTVAAQHPQDDALLADGMSILGWVQRDGWQTLTPNEAYAAARDTWMTFDRLGLLPHTRWDNPRPRPSDAAVALARAALVGRAEPASRTTLRRSPQRRQQAIQLTVSLRHIKPRIWRRLLVPASLTLRELHAVIQAAMGWDDYHLHLFEIAGVLYGDVEEIDDGPIGNEEAFTIGQAAEKASTFRYEYDFGDGWEHDIRVDKVLPSLGIGTPQLTGGSRACPPEDCGGPWGYQELLDVLADPSHPEHQERLEWAGGEFDPEAFDIEATNANLDLYHRHTRPGH